MKEEIINRQQLHELFIYVALWLVVFLAPLVDIYLKASGNSLIAFRWTDVGEVWCGILPFFLLFLVHNFLLAPRLLFMKRIAWYVIAVVCVLVAFLCLQGYGHPPRGRMPHIPQQMEKGIYPCTDRQKHKEHLLPVEFSAGREVLGPRFHPWMLLGPSILCFMIAVLMLGFNIAIKLLFKSQRDEEVLKELERHNLQQELEYLKYQINPHFFMNTLNNIHALVDINAEKAKTTLLELSKLMRYVLYEGSNRTILLSKEVEFLKHYVALMRLRYTDKVAIEMDMPTRVPEVQIPPLLFISFVENAFKHGISYQSASFIRLLMKLESGELFFRCINSRHAKNEDPHSGIGLENVRKRLKLLYGNDYSLNIADKSEAFEVLLVIPVSA